MLCPTCPKRATCETACDLLERELARIEKPCLELLMPPEQLEKLAASGYLAELNSETDEKELEDEDRSLSLLFDEKAVRVAMDELTPKQKTCLQFFYWENLSHYQIAEKLGITRPAVAKHMKAAHAILRKYLINSLKTGCPPQLYI